MIYFDNAATTFPKPASVIRAVGAAMENYGANPGRSGHALALETSLKVYECREAVGELFGAQPEQVVFTANCSHALNLAIKGTLSQGDHVIISDFEHNSVFRPVYALAHRGLITYSVAEVAQDDESTLRAFERLITPATTLIACTHGSNAFGVRLPIEKIGQLARRFRIKFLVDAAQTAGVLDINIQKCGIDYLCTAGHKSLYGPSGTGLLVTPYGDLLNTLMEGGSGSNSVSSEMPDTMPERLECGTVNTAGIIGLNAGIKFVQKNTVGKIHLSEMRIAARIYNLLAEIPNVILYTDGFNEHQNLPVISFNISGMPSEEVTQKLSDMGFALRGGLHCAPLAHKKMGTIDSGTARISVGIMNTSAQADMLCSAISKISVSCRR